MSAAYKTKSVETELLVKLLDDSGVTVAYVARQCGLAEDYLLQQISKSVPILRLRAKIESALSHRQIWSTRREIRLRKRFVALYQTDPALLHVCDLKALGRRLGIDLSFPHAQRSRRHVLDRVLSFVANK